MLYVTTIMLTFDVFCFFPGTSGTTISLTANFFRIVSRPQWVLYQYHVDFQPPIDSRRLRTALLFQHGVLGVARTFDGALLILPHRLHDKVSRWIKPSLFVRWVENDDHSFGSLAGVGISFAYLTKCATFYYSGFRRLCCTVRPAVERRSR